MNAADILKALTRKVDKVQVTGMGEFEVTGLTLGEFLDASQHTDDQTLFFGKAILHGTLDGEGKKLFKPSDLETIVNTSNVDFILTLGSKILELSQMTVEDAKK